MGNPGAGGLRTGRGADAAAEPSLLWRSAPPVWRWRYTCLRMAWRFRKSLKLGPLRFNLSKSGIGTSIGVRGFRVGTDAKGRSYTAASIPGTGLYSRTYSSAAKDAAPPALSAGATGPQPTSGRGLAMFLLFAAGVLVGVLLMGILSSSPPPAPASPPAAVTAPIAPQPATPTKRRTHRAKKPSALASSTGSTAKPNSAPQTSQ